MAEIQKHAFPSMAEVQQPKLEIVATCLLLFSFLVPPEASINIGITWTARKFALVCCLVALVPLIARKISDQRYVPVVADFFFLALAAWCMAAMAINTGVQAISKVSAIVGLEIAIPYFLARCFCGDKQMLYFVSRVFLVLLIVLLIMGLCDIAAGKNVISSIAADIFGTNRGVKFYGEEAIQLSYTTQYRFGLPRVRGPLDHAILYGGFMAWMMTVMLYISNDAKTKAASFLLAGLGVVIALSSAPILTLFAFLAIAAFDALFRNVRIRWTFLMLMIGILALTYFLLVDDPVGTFIKVGTLDPATGYARLTIWEWVGKNLVTSPWVGIGDKDWFRPTDLLSSIDSLWLNLALKYGYVGLAIFIGCIVGCFFVVTPRKLRRYPDKAWDRPNIGLNIFIFQFFVLSFTVHVWGATWSLAGFLFGMKAALTEAPYLPPRRG